MPPQVPSDSAEAASPVRQSSLEQTLVARCRAGEPRAFTELYQRYAPQILRHLRVLLGPTAELEDALQLVFEHAFRRLATFEGRSSLGTWLHGIAINVALNQRRSSGRRQRVLAAFPDSEVQHPSYPAQDARADARTYWRELAVQLEELLGTESEPKRAAFLLYFVEGLDLKEVAARMNSSLVTTWARIRRTQTTLIARARRRLTGGSAPWRFGR